ncbi:MAG: CAP domain-containing protein [Oribacterium parvum]|uniref:CAP domain-containing protein n=1 Tax=Oribacterium parvum TaxID=1501329 RepID=A0A930DT62_9FIRM|nr:CAP domain-containing protein [Oribacterium parvum]
MKKNIRKKTRLFRTPISLIHSLGNSLRVLPGSLCLLPSLLCAFMSFVFLLSGTAQADWVKGKSKNAWWFDFGNGDYFKSSWQWIDGNQDGIAECYCFDENGWMYENTITPDGYTVNGNGAWTVSNIVQTKPSDLIPKNNTNNSVNTVSNTFTETQNNNLAETRSYEENQSNEDFNEKQDEYRADLLRRVNKYRDRQGLNTLEENDYLNEMAQIRAEELSVRFSHIRPNGGSLIGEYGVNGEIATKGSKTPKDAFLAFKVSKQHNEVMLHRTFLTFGSGYYVDGNGKSYWVVLFSTDMNPY